jgi:hypothetical protein
MRSVAERLIDGTATAAERERGFAGEIVRSSVDVDEFDGTFGRFHPIWAIGTDGDFNLSHILISPTLWDSSKDKKISLSEGSCRGNVRAEAAENGPAEHTTIGLQGNLKRNK